MEGYDVTRFDFASPLQAWFTVHKDLSILNEDLGFSAGTGDVREFQQVLQFDKFSSNGNCLHKIIPKSVIFQTDRQYHVEKIFFPFNGGDDAGGDPGVHFDPHCIGWCVFQGFHEIAVIESDL